MLLDQRHGLAAISRLQNNSVALQLNDNAAHGFA